MILDDFILKLEEIRKIHGGKINVTGYPYDGQMNTVDINELVTWDKEAVSWDGENNNWITKTVPTYLIVG